MLLSESLRLVLSWFFFIVQNNKFIVVLQSLNQFHLFWINARLSTSVSCIHCKFNAAVWTICMSDLMISNELFEVQKNSYRNTWNEAFCCVHILTQSAQVLLTIILNSFSSCWVGKEWMLLICCMYACFLAMASCWKTVCCSTFIHYNICWSHDCWQLQYAAL